MYETGTFWPVVKYMPTSSLQDERSHAVAVSAGLPGMLHGVAVLQMITRVIGAGGGGGRGAQRRRSRCVRRRGLGGGGGRAGGGHGEGLGRRRRRRSRCSGGWRVGGRRF